MLHDQKQSSCCEIHTTNGQPPEVLAVQYNNVPRRLRDYLHWVGWHYEHRPDQTKPWAKVPIQLHKHNLTNGSVRRASVNKGHTWVAWETAKDTLQQVKAGNGSEIKGLGFCIGTSPIVGVDLDNCRDAKTGAIDEWAAEIIHDLDTYTEVSPSGTGLRLLCFGELPETGGRRKYRHGPVEMYDRTTNRFLTITGHRVENTPDDLEQRSDQLQSIHQRFVADLELADGQQVKTVESRSQCLEIDDEEIVALAREHHGDRFESLWSGHWEGAYSSQSEADLALCGLLAFYTGNDEDRLDGMFRQSNLMRDKWERDDYRSNTLGVVLDDLAETYNWDTHGRKKDREKLLDLENKAGEIIEPSFLGDERKRLTPTFVSWDQDCTTADAQADDWFLPGWAEFGTMVLFTGLPFSGKSSLIAEMIAAMAQGGLFCDMVVKPVPFILFDLENKEKTRITRIKRALRNDPGRIGELYHRIDHTKAPMPLTPEFIGESIEQLRCKIGATAEKGIVIVDTMRSAFFANELDVQEMLELLVPLKQLAYDTGWLVLVLHHNAKHSNAYSGSTAIASVADFLWNWTSSKKDLTGELSCEGRGDYEEPLEFQYDEFQKRLVFIGQSSAVNKVRRDAKKDIELARVIQHCGHDWMPQGEVEQRVFADDQSLVNSSGTFRRRLADALDRGYVERREQTRPQPNLLRLTTTGNAVVDKYHADRPANNTV